MAHIFEKELEFVQLLCNPEYIRWLYNNNYFTNQSFLDYLKYLLYFKDYKYGRFLVYPQSVAILEILTKENILKELSDDSFYTNLSNDQYYMWKHRE